MLLNHSESEKFVNNITSPHTDIPLTISLCNDVIMPQYKDNNIRVSDFSMVLMLLESCSIVNRKLFDKLLFYYYWAIKNFILGELQSSEKCINSLIREVNKKKEKLKGIGNKVQFNLYFDFVFGHEATHHSFANNDPFKKESMNEIVGIINETYFDAFHDKIRFKNIIKQPLKDYNQNRRPVEECACDRESLKYIHKTYIENANLNEQDYSTLLNQLLFMVSMIHYEGTMNSFSRNRLTIRDMIKRSPLYNKYLNELIEREVFRLYCAAFALQEVSISPTYNPLDTFNLIVKENYKMLYRLMPLGISNLAYSVNGTTSNCIDSDLRSALYDEINNINANFFALLLKE